MRAPAQTTDAEIGKMVVDRCADSRRACPSLCPSTVVVKGAILAVLQDARICLSCWRRCGRADRRAGSGRERSDVIVRVLGVCSSIRSCGIEDIERSNNFEGAVLTMSDENGGTVLGKFSRPRTRTRVAIVAAVSEVVGEFAV